MIQPKCCAFIVALLAAADHTPMAIGQTTSPAGRPEAVRSGRYCLWAWDTPTERHTITFDGTWSRDDVPALNFTTFIDGAAGYRYTIETLGTKQVFSKDRTRLTGDREPAYVHQWQTATGRPLDPVVDNGRTLVGIAARLGNPLEPSEPAYDMEIWKDERTNALVRVFDNTNRATYERFNFSFKPSAAAFAVRPPPNATSADLTGPDAAHLRPPADAATIMKLIITPHRLGGLSDISKRADVQALLGRPEVEATTPTPEGPNTTEVTLGYPSLGLRVVLDGKTGGVTRFQCVDPWTYGTIGRAFPGKTDRNIGIGSTAAEVRKVYGPPGEGSDRISLAYPDVGLYFALPIGYDHVASIYVMAGTE